MKRRDFVQLGVLSAPSLVLAQSAQGQQDAKLVPAGMDRRGETHSLGFSKIAFKISSVETGGRPLHHGACQSGERWSLSAFASGPG